MGPSQSGKGYRNYSTSSRLQQTRTGVRKFFYITDKNGTSFEIEVPDDTLTCGWLLSETLRTLRDQDIVGITTRHKNEFLDYWLNRYEKTLVEIRDREQLVAVYGLDEQGDRLGLHCFHAKKVIGRGGFSRVLEVRRRKTGELYAMKTISKSFIESKAKIPQIYTELEVLKKVQSPFVVTCHYAFTSRANLHILLDFCPGGELFFHMHNLGRFTERQARFYFAEIALGLNDLHKCQVVYRDLKPENILLDVDGHIKLTDFGLAKMNMGAAHRTNSFCGSPEYISPEMLRHQGHGRSVDYYTLGALLFEMLTGLPPFYHSDRKTMYRLIIRQEVKVPDFLTKQAKSLLRQLLCKDPQMRLGSLRGFEEIQQHPWCRKIDWNAVYQKRVRPPFKLSTSTSNFDPEYTSIPLETHDFDEEADYVDPVYGDFFYEKSEGFVNELLPANFGGYDPTNDFRIASETVADVAVTRSLDQTGTTMSSAGLLSTTGVDQEYAIQPSLASQYMSTPQKTLPPLKDSPIAEAVGDEGDHVSPSIPEQRPSLDQIPIPLDEAVSSPERQAILEELGFGAAARPLARNLYISESEEDIAMTFSSELS